MDAQLRREFVVGAALLEGDAADDVVAIGIGDAVKSQQLGHLFRRTRVDAHDGMVLLIDGALTGHVEDIVGHVQALVHRPVQDQVFLCAAEDARVAVLYFFLRESALPHTNVINVTLEGGTGDAGAAAERECRDGAVACIEDIPRRVRHQHRPRAQRVGAHVEDP